MKLRLRFAYSVLGLIVCVSMNVSAEDFESQCAAGYLPGTVQLSPLKLQTK